jgi:kinesin family member 12
MVVECTGQEDIIAVLHEGMKNRHHGSHELNKDSSRSHSILTVYLISQTKNANDGHIFKKYGKISFVDLAGSERLKESKSEGVMAKETGSINKSLFALGKVISMLSKPGKELNAKYIPYRDSKLTMLLMDSLGGTSKALMIACISPSQTYIEETLSTLNYACRTMNIKNKPVI